MPYFNKKQISKAKEMDLFTYLQNYEPDELIPFCKGTFVTKSHDSLKISNGLWFWFSKGIGGKSALEYLIQVRNFSFTEAVAYMLSLEKVEKSDKSYLAFTKKVSHGIFVLPEKAINNEKAIFYLQNRGISKNIIDYCISLGLIYQDVKNNVVFVGYDEYNHAKYAMCRGTLGNRFMQEIDESDKSYSFRLKSVYKNNIVHLFESAIDLLSYATIRELQNEYWCEENLLSLAGIYKPAKNVYESKIPSTLDVYLKDNPNISKIYIHFDNDNAGRLASKTIQLLLSDRYEIIDNPPILGKDFNDYLCNYFEKSIRNSHEIVR